ncbi:MAG: hypothetical protein LIO65_04980 [Odoribacter sp.]|nr:hypothetical protein [Odoribacter sp.]
MTSSISSFEKLLNKKSVLYILLAVISIVFLINYNRVFDIKPDMNGDNIYYYSLGKAFSEGKGFTNIMGFTETPHTHFPPGYPVFVGGVMKVFSDNIKTIKVANGVLLFLLLIKLIFLLKNLCDTINSPSFACLLCAMHGEILRYATIMMSEMLFLFFSIIAIYCILKLDEKKLFTRQGWIYTLLLVVLLFSMNYIYFIRTMGLSLILALLFYSAIVFAKKLIKFLKERKEGETAEFMAIAKKSVLNYGIVLLLLVFSFGVTKMAWDARNRNVGKTQSDYVGDFKKKPNGEVMSTTADWMDRIGNNFTTYITRWIPSAIFYNSPDYNTKPTTSEWFKGLLIIAIMIFGLVKLREGALLIFLYLSATMAVLLAWPEQYGGMRYFLCIIPFFIFLFLNGLKELINYAVNYFNKKSLPLLWQTVVVTLFCSVFMFPAYASSVKQQEQLAKFKTWTPQIAHPAFLEYLQTIQWCQANLPESARIISRKPEIFYIYSGGMHSEPFPYYGEPQEIYDYLIRKQATHVVVDHWFRHAYTTLYPTIIQFPDNFKLICRVGGTTNQFPPTLVYEFNP